MDSSTFPGLMNGTGGSGGLNIPSMNLPQFNQNTISTNSIATSPNGVYSLLNQGQPQSLTNALGPLLQQIFGTQGNLMQPIFQQQTNQNVASAQSDAMARGLTGSSIESGNMNAARVGGDQAFTQYLSGQLNNLFPAYANLMSSDVSNQSGFFNNLAQAVGQQYSNKISQQQFQDMLNANMSMANSANNTALIGAGISAVGNMAGGMMSDIRLKENVEKIGDYEGIPVYSFNYKKNTKFDLPSGKYIGCMGHEVINKRPDCVILEKGYFKVNYAKLIGKEKVN